MTPSLNSVSRLKTGLSTGFYGSCSEVKSAGLFWVLLIKAVSDENGGRLVQST